MPLLKDQRIPNAGRVNKRDNASNKNILDEDLVAQDNASQLYDIVAAYNLGEPVGEGRGKPEVRTLPTPSAIPDVVKRKLEAILAVLQAKLVRP